MSKEKDLNGENNGNDCIGVVSKRKYPDICVECGADNDFLQPYNDELFICEKCRITLPYVC